MSDLASRLGVGERQLRRLFDKHLGASPITVAQTRRVLLAKQLIHDTQLSMTDVALASGFGSVRQFNEVFQRLYGRPPNSLRRTKASTSAATPSTEIKLRLSYQPPYDWAALLCYLQAFAIPEVELVDGLTYCRTIDLDGATGSITVRPSTDQALEAIVQFPRLAALPTILARLRRVFDLSADPEPITRHLAQDPLLAPLVAAWPGLRVSGAWDGFEFAVRTILADGNTDSKARTSIRKIVNAYGASLTVTGPGKASLRRTFPRPKALATANLTELGIPRAKATAIAALARMTSSSKDPFRTGQSLEDMIAQLCEVPEIGDATAEYIAMRQFREPDAFPLAADEHMRLFGQERVPIRELAACSESWRPWRAYAAQYLWYAQNISEEERRGVRSSIAATANLAAS